jgi:two-component system sensor histidine kinase QseC
MSGKRGQVARPARRRSPLGRLAWLVLSLLVSVWAVVALVVWFDARHEVEEILDSYLAQAAALVVGQVRQDHHVRGGRIDMPELHRYAYKTAIQVLRGDTVLLRSANAPVQPLHPAAAAPCSRITARAFALCGSTVPTGGFSRCATGFRA